MWCIESAAPLPGSRHIVAGHWLAEIASKLYQAPLFVNKNSGKLILHGQSANLALHLHVTGLNQSE